MKNYVGVVGLNIILDTGVDLSGATLLQIKYQKPDGTTGAWSAIVDSSTKVKFTTIANSIDKAGAWTFQAYVETAGGKFHGETISIIFSELFDESSLCGLQTVKRMIGQTVAQSDDDALIESLIMQETDFIQNFCCREFFYNTYTEYIDGDGGDHIFVGESPIASVTSVHDDVDRVYGANTLIPVTDYFVDTNNGIIKLTDSVTDEAYGNVKVIYLGGFKVIPKDLELACCQRVYADYLELKGGVNVLEGETVTYKPSNLRKQAQEVIDRYKRIR